MISSKFNTKYSNKYNINIVDKNNYELKIPIKNEINFYENTNCYYYYDFYRNK